MESRYNIGFSYSDRSLLDELHYQMFGKVITNTGCSDCYRDAYILITTTLKRKHEMPTPKSNYKLKAGVVLHRFGSPTFYVNPLPNDDVAEEHLALHPGEINLFAAYPVDWEDRVEAYKARKASENATPTGKTAATDEAEITNLRKEYAELVGANDSLKEQNKKLSEKVESLEAQNAELNAAYQESAHSAGNEAAESDEVANLRMEVETLKADLEAANAEITNLKNDNRALKAANTRLKNAEKSE